MTNAWCKACQLGPGDLKTLIHNASMDKQTRSLKTETTGESIDFFGLASVAGTTRRMSIPTYDQVIETLAFIFDQKPDDGPKTRADAMSASRNLLDKRRIYRQLVSRLLSTWGISKDHGKIVELMLEKVENILSITKSSAICSSETSERGNAAFFRKIVFPQVILTLCHLRATQDDIFWREMYDYLNEFIPNKISVYKCIEKLKNETRNLLSPHPKIDFRLWLAKLDSNSFPKLKNIQKRLSDLNNQIGNTEKTGSLITNIKCKFLAAKATIHVIKFIEANPRFCPQKIEGSPLIAHLFLSRHICTDSGPKNSNILDDLFDDRILDIKYLTENFLDTIDNQDIEDMSAKIQETADSLLSYKDGILFTHAIYKKLIDCFHHENINEEEISRLERIFISTKDNHQYGRTGFIIASLLLGQKVKTRSAIPNRSLEPLIMEAWKYSADPLKSFRFFLTPFGTAPATLHNSHEYGVAALIGQFNREMIESGYEQHLCNPFENLNHALGFYLAKRLKIGANPHEIDLPSRLDKRPNKSSSINFYDTVKNINEIFFTHELVDVVMLDEDGAMYMSKSRAGHHINEYLALSDTEKREILEMICPQEYQADIKKLNQ